MTEVIVNITALAKFGFIVTIGASMALFAVAVVYCVGIVVLKCTTHIIKRCGL